jgi:hypothetical protein
LDFAEKKPELAKEWKQFWDSRVDNVHALKAEDVTPFKLPPAGYTTVTLQRKDISLTVQIDDGVRAVDIVTFAEFKPSKRNRVLKVMETHFADTLDELHQGTFVILQLVPDHSPLYTHPFVIGEIHKSLAGLDTTNPNVEFPVQVYLPTDKNSLDKKFVKWLGDDKRYWQPTISRGMVKGIVELTSKGRKLTSASKELINSIHF